MSMSRQDYNRVAEILKDAEPNTDLGLRIVVYKMADMFKADNPRFVHERFYEACGLAKEHFKDLRNQ